MKNFIALGLIILLVFSMCSIALGDAIVPADKFLGIELKDGKADSDGKITIIVSTNENTDNIDFEVSSDGTAYTIAAAAKNSDGNYEITGLDVKKIFVRAKIADVVSDSVMIIGGKACELAENLWNEDFSDAAFNERWNLYVLNAAKTERKTNSVGSVLYIQHNDEGHPVRIEDTGVSHGKAMYVGTTQYTNSTMRIDNFGVKIKSGIAKVQWDVKLAQTTTEAFTIDALKLVLADGTTTTPLKLSKANGNLSALCGDDSVTIDADWHTLTAYADIAEGKLYYYVDGRYLSTVGFTKGQEISRAQALIQYVANVGMHVDNFVVDRLSFPVKLEDVSVISANKIKLTFSEEFQFQKQDVAISQQNTSFNVTDVSQNGKEVTLTADKRFYTGVPLNVVINKASVNGVKTIQGACVVPLGDFDVVEVAFAKGSGTYTATAQLQNKSAFSSQTAIMVVVLYDSELALVDVSISDTVSIAAATEGFTTPITVTSAYSGDVKYARAYFIDDWATARAIKNTAFIHVFN